jgi:hypothetical protein
LKKIYIHVGAHKTGSTLLQNLLQISESELLRASVLYIPISRVFSAEMRRELLTEDRIIHFNRMFNSAFMSTSAKHVVMSAEGLFGNFMEGYSNIDVPAQNLRSIFDGHDIHIVAFVRKQDTMIESYYHQMIKWGKTISFDQYLQLIDKHAYKWDQLLDNYAEIFGLNKMHVFPYESIIKEKMNGIFKFFNLFRIKLLGSINDWPQPNPSLSKKGLEVAKACNPLLSEDERELMRKFLENNFEKAKSDSFQLFSEEERNQLIEYYKPYNERLFSRYMKKYEKDYYLSSGIDADTFAAAS